MPKYAISWEGYEALKKLKNDLENNIKDILEAGTTLRNTVDRLEDSTGVFANQIRMLIGEISRERNDGAVAIQTLSQNLAKLASDLEQMINKGLS